MIEVWDWLWEGVDVDVGRCGGVEGVVRSGEASRFEEASCVAGEHPSCMKVGKFRVLNLIGGV